MTTAIEVTDSTFDAEVLKSDIPVLVDFWAEWCGPCKMISPIVEEIGQELEGQLKIVKVDVDSSNQTAWRYDVLSIPTLILFKNGQVVERVVGAMPKAHLLPRIQPHLR